MAIILCPECKKEVSDQAISCPHCGFPIQQSNNAQSDSNIANENNNVESNTSNKKLIKAIIGVGLLIVGVAFMLTNNTFFGLCFLVASVFEFYQASE